MSEPQPQVLDTSYRVVPDFFRCGSFCLLFSSGGKSNENYTAALKTSLKEILSFKDGDFIEKSCSNLSARSYRNAAKYCTVSRLDRGTALSFLSRKGINGKDPSLPHAERRPRLPRGQWPVCKASAHIPEWQTAVPETPSAITPSTAPIAKTPPKRRGRKAKTVVAADKTSIMTKPENEKELSHGNEQ